MSEWKEYKLGDIAKIKGGKRLPLGHNLSEIKTSHPYIRTRDIRNNRIAINELLFVPDETFPSISNYTVEKEDVIISIVGTIGLCAIIPVELHLASLTENCAKIVKIDSKILNSKYLFYFLISSEGQEEIERRNVGSTQPKLPLYNITSIPIILPSISEQKAIASILSSLDDKIDLLHRQIKTLEAMAGTLFRQWFIEEEDERWEEKKLDELLTISSSKRIFYKEYVSYGIPFYRSKEIIELSKNGSTNSELFITFERFEEINEKFGVPQNGDILLTSVGTLGVPYQVRGNTNFYFKDGNLTWFKNFKGISSNIIYCWLKSRIGQDCLESITIGSTQAALTISGLKNITLKSPPSILLKELDLQLSLIYDKIDTNQKQIQSLENLRDSLLPKLMSGEVRVKF